MPEKTLSQDEQCAGGRVSEDSLRHAFENRAEGEVRSAHLSIEALLDGPLGEAPGGERDALGLLSEFAELALDWIVDQTEEMLPDRVSTNYAIRSHGITARMTAVQIDALRTLRRFAADAGALIADQVESPQRLRCPSSGGPQDVPQGPLEQRVLDLLYTDGDTSPDGFDRAAAEQVTTDAHSPNDPEPEPTGDGAPVWDLVVRDMKERDRTGEAKYGTRLKAGNGRRALVDAYQETLDLAVYLRQEIEERSAVWVVTVRGCVCFVGSTEEDAEDKASILLTAKGADIREGDIDIKRWTVGEGLATGERPTGSAADGSGALGIALDRSR